MSIDIHIQNDGFTIPSVNDIKRWVEAAIQSATSIELSIQILSASEMQALNKTYRQKDKPTNVLSFPAKLPEGLPIQYLGDMVLCPEVIESEAAEQQKSLEAHWAHMLVHGTLHLQGFDHAAPEDAEKMEALEVQILKSFGIDNPYGVINE